MGVYRKEESKLKFAKWVSGAVLMSNIFVWVFTIICTLIPKKSSSTYPSEADFRTRLVERYMETAGEVDVQGNTDTSHDISGKAEPGLEFLSLLKPVAHFSGLDFDLPSPVHFTEMRTIRNWINTDGSDRKLLYNGMVYEAGSVAVPSSGLYRVYCHLKFYVEDNKKGDYHLATFQHQIVVYRADGNTGDVLIQSEVTECRDGINDGAHLEYVSDVDAVTYLDARDSVSVRASHVSLLMSDRDWHYFGVYAM